MKNGGRVGELDMSSVSIICDEAEGYLSVLH